MIFPLQKRVLIRGADAHVKAGLGVAADYEAINEKIFAPFDGTIYRFKEVKGGNWVGIKRDNISIEFAHLSNYQASGSVKAGQLIAISGNTGQTTTGPHCHLQVLQGKDRLDPEKYFYDYSVPVHATNGSIDFMKEVQKNVLKYSQGMLSLTWDFPEIPLSHVPTQDEAYQIFDEFILKPENQKYRPLRFFLLFCSQPNAFARTYYYPKHDCVISIIPLGLSARLTCFEFAHQANIYYQEHRDPSWPPVIAGNLDGNFPSDDLISDKFRAVLNHIEVLNRK